VVFALFDLPDSQALFVQLFGFFIPGPTFLPLRQLGHAVCRGQVGGQVLAPVGTKLLQPALQKVPDGIIFNVCILDFAICFDSDDPDVPL